MAKYSDISEFLCFGTPVQNRKFTMASRPRTSLVNSATVGFLYEVETVIWDSSSSIRDLSRLAIQIYLCG